MGWAGRSSANPVQFDKAIDWFRAKAGRAVTRGQHPIWMLDVVMDPRTSDVCEPLDG